MNGGLTLAVVSGLALAFITGGVILYGDVSAHDQAITDHERRIDVADTSISGVEVELKDINRTVTRLETRQVAILESVERIEISLRER